MEDEDWKAFHKATECHICQKSFFRYNTKKEIEFWHPDTGEYCGKVHRFTKAPGSRSSCYSEVLKLETQDENGKYNIKEWHPRNPETIAFSLAPFVRPPTFVHFTIVICVSRGWLQTTY